jgi:CBS domain-containing protein
MIEDKKVKDIMGHIDEYDTIELEARLCDALATLKENHEKIRAGASGTYHTTLFVTDPSKKIVGKLTMFDLIRGLVPEPARKPESSKSYYRAISSRAMAVADEVGEFQERFKWLHSTFFDLVVQETQKKVKDVMSPVHPLLEEDDNINKAIYVMFKENIRQPLVTDSEGEISGVVNFMDIFPVLLEIAGHECFLT